MCILVKKNLKTFGPGKLRLEHENQIWMWPVYYSQKHFLENFKWFALAKLKL